MSHGSIMITSSASAHFSQKCALVLDVPHIWFNNWPDDDSMS